LIGGIIQARMGSSRLPGKVMMKLDDKNTVLEYVINQLSFCKLIDRRIIATTDLEQDNIIEETGKTLGLEIFRGSSDNVLDRYYECAKKFKVDHIVRITSDCPLIDPEIVDRVIEEYLTKKYDYVSNTLPRTFPIGTDVEIFSFSSLEKIWENATLSSEKEHVTPYIRNKKEEFSIGNIENSEKIGHLRWTLDRVEDYNLIKKIVSEIDNRPIFIANILDLFSKQPELIKINEHISSSEGMIKSLEKDKQERSISLD
tara:strand:- start:746 stop:1516 length:771 start_codon:yes stop_codon:yes gene_type:complete